MSTHPAHLKKIEICVCLNKTDGMISTVKNNKRTIQTDCPSCKAQHHCHAGHVLRS
jgi:hypothetical protein